MGLIEMVPKVVEIQKDSWKFTVDDVDFPWYTDEKGPKISRINDEFYVIEVDILLLDRETMDFLSFGYNKEFGCSVPSVPIIGGVRFPWLLHEDGCVLTFSHKVIPTLNLKFFALQVITNLDITDQRVDDVYCSGGHLIANENESMFNDV